MHFYLLTAAEIKLYCYYCKVRNKDTKGWDVDDRFAAEQLRISRNRVYEARKKLESIGWIKIWCSKSATEHFIVPFFGFFVENSTGIHEISTKSVENSTFPLKELPALLPAQLTSEGAKPAKRRVAPPAQPDKIFKNQSAGKPAPRSSANPPTNAAPAGKPTDERRFHPAVQMVKEITKRFPKKDIWDELIEKLGEKPDTDFFRSSYVRWLSFGGSVMNYDRWIFEPLETGQIPQRFGSNGNGNGSAKPSDVPKFEPPTDAKISAPIALDERVLKAHLEDLRTEAFSAGELAELEANYAPGDWAFLMENLQK